MSVDLTALMRKVAELADDLERDYGPDARFEAGVVVVEVIVGDDEDGTRGDGSRLDYRSTTRSTAHAIGLLELANDGMRDPFVNVDPDEDEDEDD